MATDALLQLDGIKGEVNDDGPRRRRDDGEGDAPTRRNATTDAEPARLSGDGGGTDRDYDPIVVKIMARGHVKSGADAPGDAAGASAANNVKQLHLAVHNFETAVGGSHVAASDGGTARSGGPVRDIEVESFSWGITNSGGSAPIADADGSGPYFAGSVTVSDDGAPPEPERQDPMGDGSVRLLRYGDQASASLSLNFTKVDWQTERTGGYMQVELQDVLVTSWQHGAASASLGEPSVVADFVAGDDGLAGASVASDAEWKYVPVRRSPLADDFGDGSVRGLSDGIDLF